MLDDKDIEKLIEAEREVFPTKVEFQQFQEEMRKDFAGMLTAVDAYAKKADTYFQEMVMLSHKVDRHEKWILQLAEKLGLKLDYE